MRWLKPWIKKKSNQEVSIAVIEKKHLSHQNLTFEDKLLEMVNVAFKNLDQYIVYDGYERYFDVIYKELQFRFNPSGGINEVNKKGKDLFWISNSSHEYHIYINDEITKMIKTHFKDIVNKKIEIYTTQSKEKIFNLL